MEARNDIQNKRNSIPTSLLGLWVGLASIVMMFAAFTSAYIVRKSGGNWLEFDLPNIFLYSTIIIIISSLTLHGSFKAFKAGNESMYKGGMLLTFILGVAFIVTQYYGWQAMSNVLDLEIGINPASDFVYVISGIHVAHVIGGLGVLTVALVHAFALNYKVTERRINRFRLTTTYWHFVDILWIYLYIFFLTQG